jgi:hypothetical protein
MIIGNLQVNPQAAFDMGKEEFIAAHRGRVNIDLNEAWKLIEKEVNPGKVNLKKKLR